MQVERTGWQRGLWLMSVLGLVSTGCGGAAGPAAPAGAAGQNAVASGSPAQASEQEPAGLYGEVGGERVAPADPSLPGTMLRCRADDTFYKIQNARLGQDNFGRPIIQIDYEATKVGGQNGIAVVLHGDDGGVRPILMLGPMQAHGTLPIQIPFTGPGQNPFPKNLEIYFTRNDPRYGANSPTFKVSNSTVIGTFANLTRPRNWTKEEQARLSQPPPNYTNANVHPNVGRDSEIAGDATGGIAQRYVEPGGKLLGLEWRTGEWDGEKCFGGLVPIFALTQPPSIPARLVAREGYAVGAIRVQSARFVNALQLVFQRVRADGTLDAADSYDSEWVGFPSDATPQVISSDGKPVIGIKCQQGAILNGLALVIGT